MVPANASETPRSGLPAQRSAASAAGPKPVALPAAIVLTFVAQRISGLAWAKVQRLPSGSAAS